MAPDITDKERDLHHEIDSKDHKQSDIPASDNIVSIGAILNDLKTPLAERFRALFTLKNLGGHKAIEAITKGFFESSNGALIKHELAYCLGQMRDSAAIPVLTQVLANVQEDTMVRHEAGEALGAIGDPVALEVLNQHLSDPVVEVAETCELALARIEWLQTSTNETVSDNPYNSVDPAPPVADATKVTTADLCSLLIDESKPLFHRYRAMFELRNRGGSEAITALCKGLTACPKSALFRHEIAYVLGQMQDPESLEALRLSLSLSSESDMVRHECAEAIGSVATKEAFKVLSDHTGPNEIRVVRESCEIALDMAAYENSGELQYADTLAKVKAAT